MQFHIGIFGKKYYPLKFVSVKHKFHHFYFRKKVEKFFFVKEI